VIHVGGSVQSDGHSAVTGLGLTLTPDGPFGKLAQAGLQRAPALWLPCWCRGAAQRAVRISGLSRCRRR
jgi:hypothetical protein